MIADVSMALYKRATNYGGGNGEVDYELPWWTILVYFIDLIIFFPIWLYASYTLSKVFPTFAIIEDENPPAYQPVSLNEETASLADDPERIAAAPGHPIKTDVLGGPTVTSSVRSIHRLLRANGGFRAFFRGLSIKVVQSFLTGILVSIFSGSLGGAFTPLATLLASLTLVQFSTAWVHIVITPASPKHFWSRLPPFRRTFEATWRAVGLYWLATEVARWLPFLVAYLGGFPIPDFQDIGNPADFHQRHTSPRAIGVGCAAFLVAILSSFFLILPAHVILVRVQASLLPVEQDTIIPFDRSFEARVEPAIVGGLGYATIKDAWATYSRAAWRRLVILSIKIALIGIAIGVAFVVVLIPEAIAIMAHTKKVERVN